MGLWCRYLDHQYSYFEALSQAIAWSESLYFQDFMDLSSIGGIVAIPLGLVSTLALAIILERLTFWINVFNTQPAIKQKLLIHFQTSITDELPIKNKQLTHPAVVFYRPLIRHKNKDLDVFERNIKVGINQVGPSLRRYDTALSTIIAIAPLLGLLGTVLGLIRSFQGLGLGQPLENADIVISGISEALISTAIGLVIAIVTLAFTNLFRSFRKTEQHALISFASGLEEQCITQR